jgi:hypothetical protein
MNAELESALLDEQRHHEEAIDRLSETLARAGPDPGPRADLLLYSAQLIRHRIRVALLAARLAAK